MTLFPVLVNVYHKEQLVTKEEAEKAATDIRKWQWRWEEFAVAKDDITITRIADILDECGFNDFEQRIGGIFVYSLLCVIYKIHLERHNHLRYLLYAAFMHLLYSLYVCVVIHSTYWERFIHDT